MTTPIAARAARRAGAPARDLEPLEPRRLLASAVAAATTPAPADRVGGLYRQTLPLSLSRQGIALATAGPDALFAGGYVVDGEGDQIATDRVDVYDAATGRWSVATLSVPRAFATALTVGDKVLIGPGSSGSATGGTAVEAYDVFDADTGQWTTLAPPGGGGGAPIVAAGDKVIFRGPSDSGTFEVWDATTGTFAPLPLPHESAVPDAAPVAVGGRALFFYPDAVEVYDPAANAFSSTLPPTTFTGSPRVVGSKIFFDGDPGSGAHAGVYDPSTGAATPAPPAPTSTVGASVAVAGDKVVFAGGVGGYNQSDAADVFDVDANAWTTGTLSESRGAIAAAALDGRAYFIGGTYGYDVVIPSAAADVYDAATGAWSSSVLSTPFAADAAVAAGGEIVAVTGAPFGITADARSTADVFTPSSLPTPTDPGVMPGAGLAAAPTQFTWAPTPGATAYDVYLDDRFAAHVTTDAWTIDRPVGPGNHAWQIVARDATELTAGPRWDFTVGAPGPVTHPSLRTGARVPGSPTRLSWSPSAGASSYDVYVDGRLRQTVETNAITFGSPVGGGDHTWQVIARNALARTPGPVWRFRTPVAPLTRRSLTAPHAHDAAATALAVGRKFLIAGGTPAGGRRAYVDVYDAATERWSTTTLPRPLQTGGALNGVAVGARALLANGITAAVYDTTTGRWTTHPLAQQRYYSAVTAAGDQIFIAGGDAPTAAGSKASDVVDVYDATTGRWSVAHLSVARLAPTAAAAGGKVFFTGGGDYLPNGNALSPSDTVDVLDLASGRWSTARLSAPREGITTVAVGRYVLFAGGMSVVSPYGATERSDVVDAYDTRTGHWSAGRLPEPGSSTAAAVTVGDRAFLVETEPFAYGAAPVVDAFDAATGRWSALPLPHAPRDHVTPAAVGGKLAVVEEVPSGTADVPVPADVYDPDSGRWSVVTLAPAGGAGGVDGAITVASTGPDALFLQRRYPTGAPALDLLTDHPKGGG